MTTDMPDTEPPTEAIQPTVQMRDITVSFPGVLALDGVSLRLFPGEVHALLGENGAGKSTLVKALTGVHRIDRGEVLLMGQPLEVHSPGQAQLAGISTVYQEVNLAANLSVAENMMLGREPRRRFGRIDWPAMRRRTTEVLEKLHLDIDPGSPLESHSIAVQQLVSIARAMEVDARVLILDEPTSSLDTREVDELFEVVERVRAIGRGGGVHHPLPRSGVPHRQSHHRAAQRPPRRRVPPGRAPPARAGVEDDRPRARRPRRPRTRGAGHHRRG